MTSISGVFAQDSQFFPQQGVPDAKELDKDSFMSLLVTQLKNQNPLEPQANEDFIAQLANFSELEQMELMNENLTGMVILQQSNALMEQLTQAGSLIGNNVNYVDGTTGHESSGTVDSVKVTNGIAVLQVDGQDVPLGQVTEVTGPATDETDDA